MSKQDIVKKSERKAAGIAANKTGKNWIKSVRPVQKKMPNRKKRR